MKKDRRFEDTPSCFCFVAGSTTSLVPAKLARGKPCPPPLPRRSQSLCVAPTYRRPTLVPHYVYPLYIFFLSLLELE